MTEDEFWTINSGAKAQKFVAQIASAMGADIRAVHVMLNTVCNLDGKKSPRARLEDVPAPLLELAKASGLIRDPFELTHSKIISRIAKAREAVDKEKVANAFISSLSSGLLFLRSALGSLSHAIHLPMHRHAATQKGGSCTVCRFRPQRTIACHGFLARRMMHAGNVLQGELDYVLCDLEEFGIPQFTCTRSDRAILKRILATIKKLPDDAGLGELQKSLTGIFKGNKYDRQVVLEILGSCGILKPRNSISMHERWVPHNERPWPTHFFRKEWKSPVNCWVAADGVNDEAVEFWFGKL